ncbi:MAG: hypothetical protein AUH86_12430 [Acidobacteria bacterium 13_1_40CM_4_58_4]|nr:MAG: hypothetical protein AUH86_12430 [Acidobacteria bacterium 13_1_40CM_4_58_4]
MSEVANETQHEFWRPPAAQQAAALAGMVEACDRCGTEFMVGARFCHVCGTSRSAHASVAREQSWTRHLEFQNIMQGLRNMGNGLSLSTASLIAFQAIQMYRTQWLLAAVAAFVAGILLKKTPGTKN